MANLLSREGANLLSRESANLLSRESGSPVSLGHAFGVTAPLPSQGSRT
jgi:hypothetical protein